MYQKPKLERFGQFRELTQFWVGPGWLIGRGKGKGRGNGNGFAFGRNAGATTS